MCVVFRPGPTVQVLVGLWMSVEQPPHMLDLCGDLVGQALIGRLQAPYAQLVPHDLVGAGPDSNATLCKAHEAFCELWCRPPGGRLRPSFLLCIIADTTLDAGPVLCQGPMDDHEVPMSLVPERRDPRLPWQPQCGQV